MGSEEEKDTILSILVSLLVAHKHGTTLSNLAYEYHDMVGENVPFRTLGFQTLLHLLKSSKDDFDVQGHARDPIIKAHRKEKIYHMQELVRYQRSNPKDTALNLPNRPAFRKTGQFISSAQKDLRPLLNGPHFPCKYPESSFQRYQVKSSTRDGKWNHVSQESEVREPQSNSGVSQIDVDECRKSLLEDKPKDSEPRRTQIKEPINRKIGNRLGGTFLKAMIAVSNNNVLSQSTIPVINVETRTHPKSDVEVTVTAIENSSVFWVRLASHQTPFQVMRGCMSSFYSAKKTLNKVSSDYFKNGRMGAAKVYGTWMRVKILSKISNLVCLVRDIDSGKKYEVLVASLQPLSPVFSHDPCFAIRVQFGVETNPKGDKNLLPLEGSKFISHLNGTVSDESKDPVNFVHRIGSNDFGFET